MSNGDNTTLAIMAGELRAITVETVGLVVYAAPGEMTMQTIRALRTAYPTSLITETGSPSGAVMHAVQAVQNLAVLT